MKFLLSALISIGLTAGAVSVHADSAPGHETLPVERLITLGSKDFFVEILINSSPGHGAVSSRFDRVGRVGQVYVNGWPRLTGIGLADEFGIRGDKGTFGFMEATPLTPGFLKVGVGVLKKHGTRYDFAVAYPILEAFPVKLLEVSKSTCRVEQNGSWGRWRYRYRKTYRVDPNAKKLEISYEMSNMGKEIFSLEQYNHNYLAPTGTQWDDQNRMVTNFDLETYRRHWIEAEGREIKLKKKILGRLYYSSAASDIRCSSVHELAVYTADKLLWRISGNRPAARFALFVEPGALCPEIFVVENIPPGISRQWIREYRIGF